jgi:hypothetical protein
MSKKKRSCVQWGLILVVNSMYIMSLVKGGGGRKEEEQGKKRKEGVDLWERRAFSFLLCFVF